MADTSKKFSHYYREFHGYKLDFYRLVALFGPFHPAQEHALKKLWFAGNRGHKDLITDIKEIVASLTRWLEMNAEDMAEPSMNVVLEQAGYEPTAEEIRQRELEVLGDRSEDSSAEAIANAERERLEAQLAKKLAERRRKTGGTKVAKQTPKKGKAKVRVEPTPETAASGTRTKGEKPYDHLAFLKGQIGERRRIVYDK